MSRAANMPVATLADLRRVTPWLWVICARRLRRTPTALAPWIIRWGAEASSDMLRRSAMHRVRRQGRNHSNSRLGWTAESAPRVAGDSHVALPNLCLPSPFPLASAPGLDRVGDGGALALYLAPGVHGVFNSCDLQGRQAHPSLAFEDPDPAA